GSLPGAWLVSLPRPDVGLAALALGVDLADDGPGGDVLPHGRLDGAHAAGAVGDERLLHLHRLEDDDELTCLDHRTLLDGDLDESALHGGGEGAVARGRAPGLGRAAAGGTTHRPAAAAARPDAQAGREDDLEPLAADLDDDALGRLLRAVRGGGRRDVRCGEPGEALGELRLDPRRVDGEGGGVL